MNERMLRTVGIMTTAAVLDRGITFVRWGLQDGVLPFGVAVACRDARGRKLRRFMYRIDVKKLAEYSGWSIERILELNREIKTKKEEERGRKRKREKGDGAHARTK